MHKKTWPKAKKTMALILDNELVTNL